jgi:formamidopyrimidine-DNA glycosylase
MLAGEPIISLQARTTEAKTWLLENEHRLRGRRVLRVSSHGKHLLGYISGGFYFHSHLMMWGRWQTLAGGPPPERDRRERARVVVATGVALLFSAPIFNVGEGDPYQQIGNLATLGPDVLPYPDRSGKPRRFKTAEFRRRLLAPEHRNTTIGAALLNQRILSGLGNYLRAEVLFSCGLNPWKKVAELSEKELRCLGRMAPELALRSYLSGATALDHERARMDSDATLVYQPGREPGTRHLVFRRTNLPCLRCGNIIRQLRQPTANREPTVEATNDGDAAAAERTRIVYFCPACQQVPLTTETASQRRRGQGKHDRRGEEHRRQVD